MTQLQRPHGGLGRGLEALIPTRTAEPSHSEIAISLIRRNPYQPRQTVDPEALEALTASIRDHGVLQPILVTETVGGYQLVAGERRLQAAQRAGLERIPAVVRRTLPRDQLELALVENIQRADLNAMEVARAYRQLLDEFGLSVDEIAARVGKSRPAVANTLRLLDLTTEVQEAVSAGALSEGHARAIGGVDDPAAQRELVAVVISRGLSVRETEELARRLKERRPASGPSSPETATTATPDIDALEAELRSVLGTKVTVTTSRRGGRIVIEYYDRDDLGRLCERLMAAAR